MVIGIDPGKSGGVCWMSEERIEVWTVQELFEESYTNLKLFQKSYPAKNVLIEKVHAMPQQGVVSMFTFGEVYGKLQMLFELISKGKPLTFIRPVEWQKYHGISRDKGEPKPVYKDRLKDKAENLYPYLDIWENTLGLQRSLCDAILIADYGFHTL
jgi:crossover junction endodeoxyribonuclease RuvC